MLSAWLPPPAEQAKDNSYIGRKTDATRENKEGRKPANRLARMRRLIIIEAISKRTRHTGRAVYTPTLFLSLSCATNMQTGDGSKKQS